MKIILAALCILALSIVNTYAQPNPLDTNVFGFFIPLARPTVITQPVPLQIRFLTLVMNAAWDVWTQYTPNSKGFFVGGDFRRPVEEHTLRNKNTAVAYAFHGILRFVFPEKNSTWDGLILGLGLPLNDGNRDPSTPLGLTNLCLEPLFYFYSHDGWNSLGDEGGITYNRMKYRDYTGYEPTNTPYDMEGINPDKWQPQFVSDTTYWIREQTWVTPQAGIAETFAIDVRDQAYDVARIRDKWRGNRNGYAANADQILGASRDLTDKQKMLAEYFDDKFGALGTLTRFIGGLDLDRFLAVETLVNTAFLDGVSLMWYHKKTYDSVRPVTAIRWLRKNQDVVAWGGPGKGTVTMKGREWNSYLRTDAHPEYPSGTTCLCTIFAEVIRNYNGNDNLNFTVSFPAASSVIEPGFTPQQTVTVNWPTLTEMANDCGQSRNWGGVHFNQAIEESARVCKDVGTAAYNKFVKYLTGAADATPRTFTRFNNEDDD